jgi:putative FmdB family regulatory protein
MPIYQYECDECGLTFEKRQSFTDAALKSCPECTGPVHRVFQPVGIIFKGSGWYCTDNKSSSPTATPGEPKNGTSNGDVKKDEKKTESTSVTSTASAESTPSTSSGSSDHAKGHG